MAYGSERDPSEWTTAQRRYYDVLRQQAANAAGAVEANLAQVNQLFREMQAAGVGMQDDLVKYALEVLRRIQMRTPVKTGRARAAWHAVLPNSRVDDYVYTVPAQGKRPSKTFDGSLLGASTGPFDAIVGNNVEYILPLEAGHSRQAPHGMVSVTLAETADALASTIAKRLGSLGR